MQKIYSVYYVAVRKQWLGGYGLVFAIQVQILSKPGVSRYKVDRSQNPDSYRDVTVQDLGCEQMRVSGCKF
jgi:hypothetical protein